MIHAGSEQEGRARLGGNVDRALQDGALVVWATWADAEVAGVKAKSASRRGSVRRGSARGGGRDSAGCRRKPQQIAPIEWHDVLLRARNGTGLVVKEVTLKFRAGIPPAAGHGSLFGGDG